MSRFLCLNQGTIHLRETVEGPSLVSIGLRLVPRLLLGTIGTGSDRRGDTEGDE